MNANGKCVNGTKPGEGESQGEECKGEDYACIKVKRGNFEFLLLQSALYFITTFHFQFDLIISF